jgi:transcriptional regulator with XRE-family HTH domain
MEVSKRIEAIVKALELNNNSFAKKIGVSSTTIDSYIKGRRNIKGDLIVSQPNYKTIKSMVDVFHINPYYILGFSDNMFSENKETTLNSFSVEEITTYIFNHKETFKENKMYQLLMDNELKDKVIEKLKEEKENLLNRKQKPIK